MERKLLAIRISDEERNIVDELINDGVSISEIIRTELIKITNNKKLQEKYKTREQKCKNGESIRTKCISILLRGRFVNLYSELKEQNINFSMYARDSIKKYKHG